VWVKRPATGRCSLAVATAANKQSHRQRKPKQVARKTNTRSPGIIAAIRLIILPERQRFNHL